jgi:hypothetical protein
MSPVGDSVLGKVEVDDWLRQFVATVDIDNLTPNVPCGRSRTARLLGSAPVDVRHHTALATAEPPSSDGPGRRPRGGSSRTSSGRRPRMQPGDPGTALRLGQDPDERVGVPAPVACRCGTSLAEEPVVGHHVPVHRATVGVMELVGMRVSTGDRSAATIDAGGVLPKLGAYQVPAGDGYARHTHLKDVLGAWCGARLLRDLRGIAETDPAGQSMGQSHGRDPAGGPPGRRHRPRPRPRPAHRRRDAHHRPALHRSPGQSTDRLRRRPVLPLHRRPLGHHPLPGPAPTLQRRRTLDPHHPHTSPPWSQPITAPVGL